LNIIKYSALIILGGSTAIVLLEVDKVMLNQFIKIENVAYYSVASFMAMAIAVPTRSMHQITYPLTAALLNKKDLSSLKSLYHKSSLTLFIISGLLFVLLLLNLGDIYQLLPASYRDGFMIVFWIGLAKVYDALLGNNNAILYNSDYYVSVLLMGALLAILTVLFNLWLIPKFGLDGAAIASFAAFFIYNTIKLVFVRLKYNIYPFTNATFRVLGLLLLTVAFFYYLQFPFHPLVNIIIKSLLMIALYIGVLFRFKLSEDLIGVLSKFFGR
ncbi:MAG: lipopolysaccharide biosynthesis protein, partial [Flavobacteriales bacterium]